MVEVQQAHALHRSCVRSHGNEQTLQTGSVLRMPYDETDKTPLPGI